MYSHWNNKHFIFKKITHLDMSFWKRITGQYKNRIDRSKLVKQFKLLIN